MLRIAMVMVTSLLLGGCWGFGARGAPGPVVEVHPALKLGYPAVYDACMQAQRVSRNLSIEAYIAPPAERPYVVLWRDNINATMVRHCTSERPENGPLAMLHLRQAQEAGEAALRQARKR